MPIRSLKLLLTVSNLYIFTTCTTYTHRHFILANKTISMTQKSLPA